jgi:hypothetical protein
VEPGSSLTAQQVERRVGGHAGEPKPERVWMIVQLRWLPVEAKKDLLADILCVVGSTQCPQCDPENERAVMVVQERKSLLIARLGSFQEFAIGSVGHERHSYPFSFQ